MIRPLALTLLLALVIPACGNSVGASLSQRQETIAPGITGHRVVGTAYRDDDEREVDLSVVYANEGRETAVSYGYRSVSDTVTLTGTSKKDDAGRTDYELLFHFLEGKVELKDQSFAIAKGQVFVIARDGKTVTQHALEVKDLKDPALAKIAPGP